VFVHRGQVQTSTNTHTHIITQYAPMGQAAERTDTGPVLQQAGQSGCWYVRNALGRREHREQREQGLTVRGQRGTLP
jgi:hypothetical protein